jgi:uncharacterized damage-inducible protein DinB
MAKALEMMLEEFRQEAGTTRRVLERVPGDKLEWRPHARARSLGELALHVARIPGRVSRMAELDEFDPSKRGADPDSPKDVQEILTALEQSVQTAEEVFTTMSDEKAMGSWRLVVGEREIFKRPRIGVFRVMLLNHWYHHRGQIAVYLRILDVPVPAIYGRSADEGP